MWKCTHDHSVCISAPPTTIYYAAAYNSRRSPSHKANSADMLRSASDYVELDENKTPPNLGINTNQPKINYSASLDSDSSRISGKANMPLQFIISRDGLHRGPQERPSAVYVPQETFSWKSGVSDTYKTLFLTSLEKREVLSVSNITPSPASSRGNTYTFLERPPQATHVVSTERQRDGDRDTGEKHTHMHLCIHVSPVPSSTETLQKGGEVNVCFV